MFYVYGIRSYLCLGKSNPLILAAEKQHLSLCVCPSAGTTAAMLPSQQRSAEIIHPGALNTSAFASVGV